MPASTTTDRESFIGPGLRAANLVTRRRAARVRLLAMKPRTIFLLVLVVVAGLMVAAAVSLTHDGLSARAQPSALETSIAAVMRKLAMTSSARDAKNPVTNTPEVQRAARLHFADHCAICHGNDGSGETPMGRGMYPKPPDLRVARTQERSDGEIFWIIENGVRLTGMPAFGGSGQHGNSEDSWKLVHFIRHLPSLTTEERIEMEKYNPKGPEDLKEEQEEKDFLSGAPEKPGAQPEHHHH
jgi:mono/diheme cytochrome c family protein